MSWESILKEHSYILSEWSNHCFFQILSLLVGPAAVLVKVSKFQNEFMMSSYLPKNKQNFLRISALLCGTIQGSSKSLQNLVHITGETMTS